MHQTVSTNFSQYHAFTATVDFQHLGLAFEVTGAGHAKPAAKSRTYQNVLLTVCGWPPIDFGKQALEDLASHKSLRALCVLRRWPEPEIELFELIDNKVGYVQAIVRLDAGEEFWEITGDAVPWILDAKANAISKLYEQVVRDLQK